MTDHKVDPLVRVFLNTGLFLYTTKTSQDEVLWFCETEACSSPTVSSDVYYRVIRSSNKSDGHSTPPPMAGFQSGGGYYQAYSLVKDRKTANTANSSDL